jgi:CobQ-like glutamine amidotransferase family enzyme
MAGTGAKAHAIVRSTGPICTAPVLPKNPWFTDHLIWQGLRHRYGDVAPLAPLRDNAEERAHQAALQMALRSKGKMTALEATPW